MKLKLTTNIKRIANLIETFFAAESASESFEFEREFSSARRTAHIRTWEYRNDRF